MILSITADTTLVSIRPTRLGDPTPASRLYDYVLGALRPGANEYDLHLTVLLKGARGCGKRTVVRTVARKTGFHLLEVRSPSRPALNLFYVTDSLQPGSSIVLIY